MGNLPFLRAGWAARTTFTVRGDRSVDFGDGPLHIRDLFDPFLANQSCQAKVSEQLRTHSLLIFGSHSCSLSQMLILAPAGCDPFELSDMRLNVNLLHIIIGLYVTSKIMESKC